MKNQQLIQQFLGYMEAKGISKGRLNNYKCCLKKISKILKKPFKKATKEDIQRVLLKIDDEFENPYTRQGYRVYIKRFYKWLYGIEKRGNYPEIVDWFGTTIKQNNQTKPKEIITKEELQQLLNSTNTVMERAFIHVLYESGCRISELLGLKLKDIQHDDNGIFFHVVGKTGTRIIRLFESSKYLDDWMQHHPLKDRESWLWIGSGTKNYNKKLNYLPAAKMIKRIVKRAGIKKHISCHSFRHSRATELKSCDFTEFEMCDFFGWKYGSIMPRKYIRPNIKSLTRKLLKLHNQQKDNTINTDNALKQLIIKDPEVIEYLIEKMKEHGLAVRS